MHRCHPCVFIYVRDLFTDISVAVPPLYVSLLQQTFRYVWSLCGKHVIKQGLTVFQTDISHLRIVQECGKGKLPVFVQDRRERVLLILHMAAHEREDAVRHGTGIDGLDAVQSE